MNTRMDARTHLGKVRNNNEDALLVQEHLLAGAATAQLQVDTEGAFLVAVADGMGGHGFGEEASRFVLQQLRNHLQQNPDPSALTGILQDINAALHQHAQQHPGGEDMGTTLSGLWYNGNTFTVFNIGDSPIFRLERGYLREISTDDAAKGIHEDGRRSHLLLQCLGGSDTLQSITPHVLTLPPQPATFLLCSDGLTDMLSLDTIEDHLSADLQHSTETLEALALQHGGKDNITLILLQCTCPAHPQPEEAP